MCQLIWNTKNGYSVTCCFIFDIDIPMCGIVSRSARRNRIPLYLVPNKKTIVEQVLVISDVRTWPAPTLMKHILRQGLVWDQTSPNKLLMNISMHGLDKKKKNYFGFFTAWQGKKDKLIRTSGRSPRPIVLYVFEMRCKFIRTATRRLIQNITDAASFFDLG